MKLLFLWLALVPPLAGGCGPGRSDVPPGPSSEAARFSLHVSLFPWIPEAESFFAWVEADFEGRNPDIDLVVRSLERSDESSSGYVADLSYELGPTIAALTRSRTDAQHLIEIDSMLLGALVEAGAASPFDLPDRAFMLAAREAVTVNGQGFGVPHWTCGYFIISESSAAANAASLDELLATLAAIPNTVDLAGDLDGSWDSVMAYLDAVRDYDRYADLARAVGSTELIPAVRQAFQRLGTACMDGDTSYCGSSGVDIFATGKADALIGYSERLHAVLEHAGRTVGELHIGPAALGPEPTTTLFVDALVQSPRCRSRRCKDAARRFAEYYTSDEVFEIALMAGDVGPAATPRYLLPSTRSAFRQGAVANDPIYRALARATTGARPYPNVGAPAAMENGVLRRLVTSALGLP